MRKFGVTGDPSVTKDDEDRKEFDIDRLQRKTARRSTSEKDVKDKGTSERKSDRGTR